MDQSKIKVIAMDLDGTLTQHKQPLSPQARAALEALLERLCTEGMPEEALERTRATMLTQRLLNTQSGSKICAAVAVDSVLGLPADYADKLSERLAAITLPQMQQFIRRALSHPTRTWVTVR